MSPHSPLLLLPKIDARSARIAVIGLGYVGLPLACLLADAGFSVLGIESNHARAEQIRRRTCPWQGIEPGLEELLDSVLTRSKLSVATDARELADADIVLIAVDTPVDANHLPLYASLKSACRSIGEHLKRGALVIVESTVSPGTTEELVTPLIEVASGAKRERDFFVGHCPERVTPGKLLRNLRTLGRVCGASTDDTARTMVALYRTITSGSLETTDCKTAELAKTAENAYRDVSIAFANTLAILCESYGVDFARVRTLVNQSPGRDVLFAGPGVGGQCMPKASRLLLAGLPASAHAHLLTAARDANDQMPFHVLKLLRNALGETGSTLRESEIAIMGFSYREETGDARNTPSAVFAAALMEEGAKVRIHDPFVPEHRGDPLACLSGCDAAVFLVGHSVYRAIRLEDIQSRLAKPVLIDTRGIFRRADAERLRMIVRVLGDGSRAGAE